jgi:2-polyprenyl-3-methyl-5-hydroxy-6-metoxy-1,4-benzoquinol methylase
MEKNCPLCKFENIKFFVTDYKKNQYWKCNKCEFVFQNPITKYSYNENYWTTVIDPDGKEKDQTKMKEFKIKNWYGEIIEFIKNKKPGKILDVGCGLGYLLASIPNTWEKHGSDGSNFAISFMKKNDPTIIIEEINLEKPPVEYQKKFDVVVCYHVIEHIKNPDIFFKHLSMMVKSGGILIVGTPNIGSIGSKIFKGNFRLLGIGHLSLFNNKNLTELFTKNNFQIIKKEYPFFRTEYFNLKNILRILDNRKISPPFYGNIMTFYGIKK